MLWVLNHELNWNLTKLNNSEITYGYPIFCNSSIISPATLALIPNIQPDGSPIEKKLAKVDYIVEITGEINSDLFNQIYKSIKQCNDIQAAIEVSPDTIKRKVPFYIK